ncbi:MAG TPA: hypothetical protein VIL32_10465, partial [Steroidobacteraceae bacterium]
GLRIAREPLASERREKQSIVSARLGCSVFGMMDEGIESGNQFAWRCRQTVLEGGRYVIVPWFRAPADAPDVPKDRRAMRSMQGGELAGVETAQTGRVMPAGLAIAFPETGRGLCAHA